MTLREEGSGNPAGILPAGIFFEFARKLQAARFFEYDVDENGNNSDCWRDGTCFDAMQQPAARPMLQCIAD